MIIPASPAEKIRQGVGRQGLSSLLSDRISVPSGNGGLGHIIFASMMTGLPGLALGAWELNDDMIAQPHRGEAVIPTSFADGLRNNLANGPVASGLTITYGDTHLHVSAIDGQSVARFFSNNKDALVKSWYEAHRNNS